MDQPLKSLYPADGSFGSNKDDLDGAPLDVDGVPIKSKDMDGVPLRQIDIDGVPLSGDDIDGMPSKFVYMLGLKPVTGKLWHLPQICFCFLLKELRHG